jgi:hypothetical protein
MTIANVTGWNYIIQGKLIEASFSMFDTALNGWTVGILFLVFQFMLIIKTRSLTLSATSAMIFLAMMIGQTYLKSQSLLLLWIIVIVEIGGILYLAFMKN